MCVLSAAVSLIIDSDQIWIVVQKSKNVVPKLRIVIVSHFLIESFMFWVRIFWTRLLSKNPPSLELPSLLTFPSIHTVMPLVHFYKESPQECGQFHELGLNETCFLFHSTTEISTNHFTSRFVRISGKP